MSVLWISAVGWTAEPLIDGHPERAGQKAVANPAGASLALRRIARWDDHAGAE
jgi:hypothetical protein